jgi:F-type H+-transporting ATPase subunit epsilon
LQLKIMTPQEICLDKAVTRIVAEAPHGSFGMLPHHIDYVSQLVPGILTFEEQDGTCRFAGIGAGTLVKCGAAVFVATRSAALGDDLVAVRRRVQQQILEEEETERAERAALARLEAQMVRQFQLLEQQRR